MEANIRYILGVHSSLVSIQDPLTGEEEDFLLIKFERGDAVQSMIFQHYANQILSAIFPFALLSHLLYQESLTVVNAASHSQLLLHPPVTITPQDSTDGLLIPSPSIREDYLFFRELFQEDFLYEDGSTTQVIVA